MVLEATTFCVEKRGAWLPTWDWASAEAAETAAAIPSHQGLADRACPDSHPHATDALMFWSSTLGALTRTACISGPPSTVHRSLQRTRSSPDRFPKARHTSPIITSPYVFPQSHPLLLYHQCSHHQQQEKATSTVTNNSTGTNHHASSAGPPTELAILRSVRSRPRRLVAHGYTVSYEGRTSSPHHPVPESCIHPSSIQPVNVEVTSRVR